MESGLAMLAERRAESSSIVRLGFDLGAQCLEMAVPGVNSIISAAAHQHGCWVQHAPGARLWLAPDLLDVIACREAGPGALAEATVAVPGWLGALDRAALRTALTDDRHSVSIISTTMAAVTGWSGALTWEQRPHAVLCLDPDVGLSVSVVLFDTNGLREVAVASVPPRAGLEIGSPTRADLIAGLVGHVVRLGAVAGVSRIDTALALVSSADDPLVEQWPRLLAAVTPPDGPPAQPLVVQRRDVVARGAILATVDEVGDGAGVCMRTVPHRLGVIVETEQGLGVMTLVPAGHPLPAVLELACAADPLGPIRFDLLEARRPGAADQLADWESVATATLIDDPAGPGSGRPGLVQVDIRISIDEDGIVSIGPIDRWQVVMGSGAVDLVAAAGPQVETVVADRVVLGHEPMTSSSPATGPSRAPSRGEPVQHGRARTLATRTLAWSDTSSRDQPPPAAWPPPSTGTNRTSAAGAADVRSGQPALASLVGDEPAAGDDIEAQARLEAAAFVRELGESVRSAGGVGAGPGLDDDALEEIARSEIGAPSLAAALADLERRLSRQFGTLVGVRSIPALLDCNDDAGVAELRSGAQRLEAALVGQPDDDLTGAVRAAVRAARRAFADESSPRFVGGSAIAIAADAVAVVDHLRLVVGEVQAVERRRLLLDARLRGLSSRSADELVTGLIGPPTESAHEPRSAPPLVRDAVARVGVGHRGWSIEVHADPSEGPVAETRSGIAQIRLLLLEPCGA